MKVSEPSFPNFDSEVAGHPTWGPGPGRRQRIDSEVCGGAGASCVVRTSVDAIECVFVTPKDVKIMIVQCRTAAERRRRRPGARGPGPGAVPRAGRGDADRHVSSLCYRLEHGLKLANMTHWPEQCDHENLPVTRRSPGRDGHVTMPERVRRARSDTDWRHCHGTPAGGPPPSRRPRAGPRPSRGGPGRAGLVTSQVFDSSHEPESPNLNPTLRRFIEVTVTSHV